MILTHAFATRGGNGPGGGSLVQLLVQLLAKRLFGLFHVLLHFGRIDECVQFAGVELLAFFLQLEESVANNAEGLDRLVPLGALLVVALPESNRAKREDQQDSHAYCSRFTASSASSCNPLPPCAT
jgi:hypothetical protein